MKTTLELPDDLFIEAKAVALKRRTTLKAIVEGALRRELAHSREEGVNPNPEKFIIGPLGFLVLRKRPGSKPVTLETIREIEAKNDEQDLQHALHPNAR